MRRSTYKKIAKRAKTLLRRRGFRMRRYKGGSRSVRAFPLRAYWMGMPSATRRGDLDFTTKRGDLVFHRKGRYVRKSRKPYRKSRKSTRSMKRKKCPRGTKRVLRGQKRNSRGKIIKHGSYSKKCYRVRK